MPLFYIFFSAHHAGDEDFQTNADEDNTTQDGGFAGEFGAKLFAKAQTCLTEEERDRCHDEGADQCHQPAVLRDGEADGKSVDTGGHALHKESTGAQLGGLLGFLALDALQKHLAADIAQQGQCDPGDEPFKGREQLHDGVDAEPARHGHNSLKNAKGTCNDGAPAAGHVGVMQAVGQRDRECIHGKAYAQQGAVEEKDETPLHKNCLLKLTGNQWFFCGCPLRHCRAVTAPPEG